MGERGNTRGRAHVNMRVVVVRVLSSRRAMCWMPDGALLEVYLESGSWPASVLEGLCLQFTGEEAKRVEAELAPPLRWSPTAGVLYAASAAEAAPLPVEAQ